MSGEEKLIPRNYQLDLMQIAVKQNTIIYLPTGSGKTFIAILVLKQLSEPLIRAYNDGGKISLILVNSVALVDQHAKYIKDHTIFEVGSYSGEMNIDHWRKEQWEKEFVEHKVLIMTSQILVNLINNSFIDLERVNLIIFDECHRGVEDQPMRQVMRTFSNYREQPRILGLTATLLNGNCKLARVMEEVKTLETTYHSTVATVDGLETVVGYATNPQELMVVCKSHNPSSIELLVQQRLEELIHFLKDINVINSPNEVHILPANLKPLEPVDIMRNLRNLVTDLQIHTDMLGIFGGYKTCILFMIQVERIKKHCQDPAFHTVLKHVLSIIGWAKQVFASAMENCDEKERVHKFSSDKVQQLIHILKDFKTRSEEELCGLIFVKRRFTAKTLHHVLEGFRQVDPELYHLKTNFIVGNKNNPYNNTRESLYISKKNREVLDTFVNKEINLLVSSNVLEEGVDIPKCTLVIKFDKAEEYRSYIQSKGRARHKKSFYYTLLEQKSHVKDCAKYEEFQRIEQTLNECLFGKTSDRDAPSQSELDAMYNEDELPPYFVNGPNSAQVNMNSAIALLCKYCSSLATNQYTIYEPEWYMDEDPSKRVRVVVYLPVICPILEPIQGPYMPNKKVAKKATALQACIMLHKCGELDDELLPIKKELKEEDVSYLFKHYPQEKDSTAGNKKKKRLHDKKVAACVQGAITDGQTLYLHVIKLNPLFRRTDQFQQSTIYDLYTTKLCFGVLSPKMLPDTCKFPVFDTIGTIEVNVKINMKEVFLQQQEIVELREFHYMVFNDLLEILKPFLLFDKLGTNTDMLLLAPIQDADDIRIDFALIREHKTLRSKVEPPASERFNLNVTPEKYENKIISPWYRTQPSMYVVTQVCTEKNALSPFPNNDYENFMSYYEHKHNLKILNPHQPLLLVKGLSKRLNVYKPRGREGKKKREQRYEEVEEYLVPELVTKQEFPSCLWVQARFLPTILSRLTFLLKLRELQTKIAREIGADEQYLYDCPPLEVDLHLLHYVPIDVHLQNEAEIVLTSVDNSILALEEAPGTLLTQRYNKDFAMKMLEAEYAWKNIEEPKDIERELTCTVMDIEYYETFISYHMSREKRAMKNVSPTKQLPAITYNIEFEQKNLSILDVDFVNQSPNLCSIYQALSAAEANDIVNLERLETLGDAFLKFIASLYIIFKFPTYGEGKATTLKGRLVSNKNLYYLGIKKKLGGILRNSDLSPNSEWVPPCFCIPNVLQEKIVAKECSINCLWDCNIQPDEQIAGFISKETLSEIAYDPIPPDEENSYTSMCSFINKQYVGDKTIADSVEALLGAYFLNGGIKGGIKFVEWIGILPRSENMQKMLDSVEINPILTERVTRAKILFHMPQWQDLERRIDYSFRNPAYLLQALTHSSYSPNRITQSYERLEFLGDAILDFLITCYIFEHCGNLDPGQVTDLRSALVNNNTFASLVVRNGLHKFLLMISATLQGHVDKFADYLASKEYVIDDEVLILLEEEEMNLAEYVDVPKVLGDLFESLAGAVYLDCGKDLKTVWKVFYKIMWREINLFSKNVPKNVLRRLYEFHTAYPRFSKPSEVATKKVMVALEFMLEGRKKRVHGFGSNKIMAKRAAAKIALRALKT